MAEGTCCFEVLLPAAGRTSKHEIFCILPSSFARLREKVALAKQGSDEGELNGYFSTPSTTRPYSEAAVSHTSE
jgi:hypothetical protein